MVAGAGFVKKSDRNFMVSKAKFSADRSHNSGKPEPLTQAGLVPDYPSGVLTHRETIFSLLCQL